MSEPMPSNRDVLREQCTKVFWSAKRNEIDAAYDQMRRRCEILSLYGAIDLNAIVPREAP